MKSIAKTIRSSWSQELVQDLLSFQCIDIDKLTKKLLKENIRKNIRKNKINKIFR